MTGKAKRIAKIEEKPKKPMFLLPFPEEGYVNVKEVAHFIRISTQTVWVWTRQGKLPRPEKISPRCTRWNAKEVREKLKGNA